MFRVPDGFAIIKVEERRPAGALPLAEVRSGVRSRMEMEQLDQARREWLRAARQQASLVIPDQELEQQVRALIESDAPYDPTNLTPEIPMAPR